MKIGFTGTRKGMTYQQMDKVGDVLYSLCGMDEPPYEFHHGDCIGSDSDFHDICRETFPRRFIILHPGYSAKAPDDLSMRAFCKGDDSRAAKTHFARNRDIVDETDVLVATPPSKPLPTSGGTAYTINYARKQKKRIVIIYPDGSVEVEEKSDD